MHQIFRDPQLREVVEPIALDLNTAAVPSAGINSGEPIACVTQEVRLHSHITPSGLNIQEYKDLVTFIFYDAPALLLVPGGFPPYFTLLSVELSFDVLALLQHACPKGPNSWKKSHFIGSPRLLLWALGVQHYSSNKDFPKQDCPWCLHKFHGQCNKCRLLMFI